MSDQIECLRECQKTCQIKSQIECREECQKICQKKVSDQIECLRECQKICRKKISGWMAKIGQIGYGVKEKQTRYLTASGGDHSKKVYIFYLCLSPFTGLVFRWKSRLETHGFTHAAHAHYRGFKGLQGWFTPPSQFGELAWTWFPETC